MEVAFQMVMVMVMGWEAVIAEGNFPIRDRRGEFQSRVCGDVSANAFLHMSTETLTDCSIYFIHVTYG
jgi:hypothetical protein